MTSCVSVEVPYKCLKNSYATELDDELFQVNDRQRLMYFRWCNLDQNLNAEHAFLVKILYIKDHFNRLNLVRIIREGFWVKMNNLRFMKNESHLYYLSMHKYIIFVLTIMNVNSQISDECKKNALMSNHDIHLLISCPSHWQLIHTLRNWESVSKELPC